MCVPSEHDCRESGCLHVAKVGGAHAQVAKLGCGALWNLAVDADNKKPIASAGGIEAVLSALRAHGGAHAEVAEQGLEKLVRNLSVSAQDPETIDL